MKKVYETLENEKFDIKTLSEQEFKFLKKVMKYYSEKPDWNVFSNYWLKEGQKVWGGMPKREVVDLPVFRICQDLEMRLGIEQGKTRMPDFCKKAGIAQDTLSRILNKRREPSLHLLKIILDTLGYEISFQKKH